MIPLAHVAGVPVEELLPWVAGPGAGLVVVRAWIAVQLHRGGERGQ
ncbi:MAG: hypothetical protein H0X42_08500 [Solirubrobacterales bacterium]|nr:hypothetical protein [Solirubrobacterales bacterium]